MPIVIKNEFAHNIAFIYDFIHSYFAQYETSYKCGFFSSVLVSVSLPSDSRSFTFSFGSTISAVFPFKRLQILR